MLLRRGSRANALGRMPPISSPSNMMRPEVWSNSRITIIEVVDLPQPDSPTRPTLSPCPTVKLMPSTARNCSVSTGGLRPNSFVSTAVAPWRGYSLTSLSTSRRGFAEPSPLVGTSAPGLTRGSIASDVEAGGRLVGDQKLRIAGQRQRDHHALAHATRQFERIGVIALAGTGDLDLLQRLDRLLAAVTHCRLLHMLAQHVLDLVADFADRVERRARILENHRDFSAAQIAHLVFAGGPDVDAGKHHRAVGDLAGAVEDPHHRVGGDGLAGAGFADDAERLALGRGDVDMLHRPDDAAAGREFHGEITDIEQRRRGHGSSPISRLSFAGLTPASLKNSKMLFDRWISRASPAMTTVSLGTPPILTSFALG